MMKNHIDFDSFKAEEVIIETPVENKSVSPEVIKITDEILENDKSEVVK